MNVDPRTSYTAKVSLGLLIVLVVGAAVGAYTHQAVGAKVEGSQTQALESQANVHGDLVETMVTNHREDTETTGRLLARFQLQSGDSYGRMRTLLSNEAADSTETLRYNYADAETGEILVSTTAGFEGQSLASHGYEVPDAAAEVGDTAVEFRNGTPPTWVFYTDTGTGHVLVKEVSATQLADGVEQIVADSRTRVVNDDGVVVFDTANASGVGTQHTAGSGVSSPAVEAGLAGNESTRRLGAGESGNGNETVVGYDGVDGVSWSVVTYTSPNSLYAIASDTGEYVVLLLGAVAALLVGFALFVERPMLRAVGRLERDASALADGDLDAAVTSSRRDEIGSVFDSLDAMRREVTERIETAEAAQAAAESASADAEQRREEAAEAKRRVQRVNDHLRTKAEAYEDAMGAVADGDLTVRVDPSSDHDAIQSMGEQFNAVLDELEATVREVEAFATSVGESSRQVTASTQEIRSASEAVTGAVEDISEGTAEQGEFLERVDGETRDLSASIEEVASTADEVATTASEAAERTRAGQRAADDVVAAIESVEDTAADAVAEVESLVDRMEGVADIVDVIGGVAEQTSLLALNANIEAARSSADGGGFAVVADEVEALAAETSEHAADAEERIDAMQSQTAATADRIRSARRELAESVDAVTEAREAFETVAESVAAADSGMQDIDDAAGAQADSTETVAAMVDEVTDIAGETAAEAESVLRRSESQTSELAAVAETTEELQRRAEELERALDQFEVSVAESAADAAESEPTETPAQTD